MLISVALILIVVIVVLVYANRIEPNRISVCRLSVLSEQIENKIKILHLSDLHLFKRMSRKRLESMKKTLSFLTKSEDYDLVLITGDFIDNNSGIELLPDLFEPLKTFENVYAVLGNHDYIEYNIFHMFDPLFFFIRQKPAETERLKRILNSCGIKVLVDQTVHLNIKGNELELVGIDWKTFKKTKKIQVKIPDSNFYKIALYHYPDIVKSLKEKVNLVLSGHTHGGQITFFGYPVITRSKIKRLETRGLSVHGNTVLVVSKGMGVGRFFSFRFFARPDVYSINLSGSK